MAKTGQRTKIVDCDPPEPTLDDLRLIIREIQMCVDLGDEQVIKEARDALLAVFGGSAARLKKKINIVFD